MTADGIEAAFDNAAKGCIFGTRAEQDRAFAWFRKGYEALAHRMQVTTWQIASTLETQEGGTHYKVRTIQPVQYWHANRLDAFQGAVVKYITRHREKNGVQDLKKAIHYTQIYIELEYGERSKISYDKGRKVL